MWSYRGATKTGARSELALHPTVKPVAMLMDAIKDVTKRGDIVLDAFGGSGSTLLAAEKTRRKARLIEYEPGYCDVTIARWQDLTGRKAILDETGETFDAVCARRGSEGEQQAAEIAAGRELSRSLSIKGDILTLDERLDTTGAEIPVAEIPPNSLCPRDSCEHPALKTRVRHPTSMRY